MGKSKIGNGQEGEVRREGYNAPVAAAVQLQAGAGGHLHLDRDGKDGRDGCAVAGAELLAELDSSLEIASSPLVHQVVAADSVRQVVQR